MVSKIKNGIFEVGVVDWNLRNFHGYSTEKGSSYNAYLIIDDKTALIDTVKAPFSAELLNNVKATLGDRELDYIVSNHVEPDHSGALNAIIAAYPNAKIMSSNPSGIRGLQLYYGSNLDLTPVKSGDELSLGNKTLRFVQTPMIHWPDNMVTYLVEDKILFSNDSFGQHFASSSKFDDENDFNEVMYQAEKYYANIVLPYGMQVRKTLEILKSVEIEMIAPAHGIIYRKHYKDILDKYAYFSNDSFEKRAIIVFDSMWGSTEKMAREITATFSKKGYQTYLCDLKYCHISDVMTKVLKAEYVIVGSPTLNNNILPTVASFLTYFTGLAPKNKKGFAFASYGWGGQSADITSDLMQKAGISIIMPPYKVQFSPLQAKLDELTQKIDELI